MATKKDTPKTTKSTKAAAKASTGAAATASKPHTATGPVFISDNELARVRTMNLWLSLVLAAQAAIILVFGGGKTNPVTLQYPAIDQLASESAGHQVPGMATRHLFDMWVSLTAAKSLLVLALLSVLLAAVFRRYYETQLRRGSHVGRWLAFGLGGGLMMTALLQVTGVTNIAVLAAALLCTVLGFGLAPVASQLSLEGRTMLGRYTAIAAVVAAAVPWAIALGVMAGAWLWDGRIASSTYAMYATTALFFVAWALGGWYRTRRQGQWADAFYAEKMFMFLTLGAASVLAWQIFAGVL